MLFEEALPAVRAGRRAARPEWDERGCSLEIVPAHTGPGGRLLAPALIIAGPDGGRESWTWARSDRDLLADDWVLL